MLEKSLHPVIQALELVVFDFDGVFTTNQVIVDENGTEAVICNRSDGLAFRLLKAEKLPAMILSTEVNPVVQARARKLKLECVSGCPDKGKLLRQLSEDKKIELEKMAFVGNDANDLEALTIVGLGVAVGDAYPEAKAAAKWNLKEYGGRGAIREFCETVFRVRRSLGEGESPWLTPDVRATYASS
ncbi:MAG: HAD hydrolase family protein [Bdellovibrionaceae bacterium]|nr:HAD hydrolase family protein [Bdellovibrionales bacterium]MCB9254412.1 HAD hydrolase family protein [Pseudobdellovibrionaceae bacterium]